MASDKKQQHKHWRILRLAEKACAACSTKQAATCFVQVALVVVAVAAVAAVAAVVVAAAVVAVAVGCWWLLLVMVGCQLLVVGAAVC